jgi:photosystem II stability/assembly factor-like uncharacterized protein
MKSRWAGLLLVVATVGISSIAFGGFSAATDVLGQWIPVGPSRMVFPLGDPASASGRIGSIAVDPTNARHWLVGVSNGGLWETRDGGGSWAALTDSAPTLAMGAVTFDPTNPATIYAGTGDANGGGGMFKGGLGILKSTDGGVTWSVVGAKSFARGSVKRLRVNPANPGELAAASTRGGFGRQLEDFPPQPPPYGILISTDSGETWTRTLAGQATALEIDSANFNHQYAAIGEQYDGQGAGVGVNGVYRSTDGGRNWQLMAGPWPASSATQVSTGPIELALAPSDPNRLYVSISQTSSQNVNARLIGLWTTTNAWDDTPSFHQQSTADTMPTSVGNPGSYCINCQSHVITVSPSDPTVVFAGGKAWLWRRVFVGSVPQWTNLTAPANLHDDERALAWAGSRLILGNDGGVYSTTDFGATWQNHNGSLSTAMFYSGALHPTNAGVILAGLRDYSLCFLRGGPDCTLLSEPPGGEWGEADVAISAKHPDTDWAGGHINGVIYRTVDGGKTIVQVDSGIDKTGAAFVAPLRKCPANDDVFLTGTTNLWRTNNFFNSTAPSWFPNGPSDASATSTTIFTADFRATDANCGTYAYGTSKGEIRLTRDGGNTWVDLDPNKQLPARAIQSIAFDPAAGSTIYVAVSSFNAATAAKPGHVYKTTDALSSSPTWVNAGPPDDVPFNVVRLDPRNSNLVYAGSDTGLWVSGDAGATWQKVGLDRGLPNAAIYDVQINPVTNQTVVFTHGRSAFRLASTQ